MARLRLLSSLLLAFIIAASATAQVARAAGMAMPLPMAVMVDAAEASDPCVGEHDGPTAHCPLACASMTAMLSDPAEVREQMPDRPVAAASLAIASRFADPEPGPPR